MDGRLEEIEGWPDGSSPQDRFLQGGPSARSLLLTILGEYVLPRGQAVWTATLLEALSLLGVEDKAGRQALARAAKGGWLSAERIGRAARWTLTDRARSVLSDGAERIYGFDPTRAGWNGKWLLLMVSVPEERRADRHVLRTRLAWSGFGSLGQGVWISPDTSRQAEVGALLGGVEPPTRAVTFVAELGVLGDAATLVRQAWDLGALDERYAVFVAAFEGAPGRPAEGHAAEAFATKTRIVHEWRKFPFIDPGLPTEFLPSGWSGGKARALFRRLHSQLAPAADAWFDGSRRQVEARRQPVL